MKGTRKIKGFFFPEKPRDGNTPKTKIISINTIYTIYTERYIIYNVDVVDVAICITMNVLPAYPVPSYDISR